MQRQLRRMTADRERGVALILVIGIGALITALITTAIVVAVNGTRAARDDVSWQGALSAAYAGIEEYKSRLAADPGYIRYGNRTAAFSAGSTLIDDATNPAFGHGGAWATVPGSDGTATYRYEVSIATYDADGTIRLRATGRVGQETRTIIADLRQAGFLNYLYFTDYEMEDPALYNRPSSCVRYSWASARSASTCGQPIAFGNGDQIRGQVHSNDVIYACDATFYGPVSTAWNRASGVRYERPSGCGSTPDFRVKDPERGNSPAHLGVLGMPETNTQIRANAIESGCVFTGPTTIRLNDNGTMTVRSPWTRVTRPGAANATPAACGTPSAIRTGTTIPVPDGGAVYIQNVPTASGDPNTWPTSGRPTCATNGNPVGYPISNENVPAAIDGIDAYGCRNGDLFVQGTLDGQVSLAAENYVYVVGNVRYEDRDDDMLGLIGNNMVWVWNPSVSGRTNPATITIEAAILSLRSFTVQNTTVASSSASTPTLTVRGSIAQRFRGIVYRSFTGGRSGYVKNYEYDARLRFRSPPHFLSPVTTAYGISTWIETSPAFDAAGNRR